MNEACLEATERLKKEMLSLDYSEEYINKYLEVYKKGFIMKYSEDYTKKISEGWSEEESSLETQYVAIAYSNGFAKGYFEELIKIICRILKNGQLTLEEITKTIKLDIETIKEINEKMQIVKNEDELAYLMSIEGKQLKKNIKAKTLCKYSDETYAEVYSEGYIEGFAVNYIKIDPKNEFNYFQLDAAEEYAKGYAKCYCRMKGIGEKEK